MNPPVYWIPDTFPGRLGVMPRPLGGNDLAEEIATLLADRVDIVVSLLTDPEVRELQLEREGDECAEKGIEFRRFPIEDRSVPDSIRLARALSSELAGKLKSGKNLVFHCRYGIGRANLMACSVMIVLGWEGRKAFECLAKTRGCPVPDSIEQIEWGNRFKP